MRHVIAFLGAASLFSACEREPTAFSRPQQAPDGVLKVVNDHMVSKGTVMADYELDSLSYDYVDRRWSVFYTGRTLAIGDHFAVLVSDEDAGEIEVVPGL